MTDLDEILADVESEWHAAARAEHFRRIRAGWPMAVEREGVYVWSAMAPHAVDPMLSRIAADALLDAVTLADVPLPALVWFSAEMSHDWADWQHWTTTAPVAGWVDRDAHLLGLHVDIDPSFIPLVVDTAVARLTQQEHANA